MTTTTVTNLDVFDCEQEPQQQPEVDDTTTVRVSARSGIHRISIERVTSSSLSLSLFLLQPFNIEFMRMSEQEECQVPRGLPEARSDRRCAP